MRRKITYPAIVFLLLFSLMTDTASASTQKNRSRKKEAQAPYTLNMTTSDLLLGDSFILTVNAAPVMWSLSNRRMTASAANAPERPWVMPQ